MSDRSTVLFDVHDAVCEITLNRPDRLNAWTGDMGAVLARHLIEADADPRVRAIVITGAGRGFCAGADVDDLHDLGDGTGDAVLSYPVALPAMLATPVVAAVNGPCAGLGLVLALACDVRFAADTAVFSTAFSRRGLVAEHGISWLLPRIVGRGRAHDLLLSARRVTADEAGRIGLVEQVVAPAELLAQARAYAGALAQLCSPSAMASIKDSLARDEHSSLAASLELAEAKVAESLTWPDLAEGVASFVEKRPPRFRPRIPTNGESRP